MTDVYKMVKGNSGMSFDGFFEYDTNGRTRGHSKKLRKKRFNTNLRKYFFTDRIINTWNALDHRTVTSATLNSFKNGLERLRNSKKMGLLRSSVAKDPWGRASPLSGEASSVSYRWVKVKVKASHTRHRVLGPELIPVYRQSACRWPLSHPPGSRLPLLSARPAVTSPAAEHHRPLAGTKLYCLVTRHIGVNNLPKVVTQRCLQQDLNPRPTDRKPKCLTRCTTAPPW